LIAHELADVRIGSGVYHRERVAVRDLIEDAEVAATMDANARSLQFSAVSVPRDVVVDADRQVLASVLTILTKNALRFTTVGGRVMLKVRTSASRVLIDVEDRCGGLPPGTAETLLGRQGEPGSERAAAQLGLSICERGAHESGGTLSVRDIPGTGCVFTLDLPRALPLAAPAKASS
jgi:signal transduction histidine kinase